MNPHGTLARPLIEVKGLAKAYGPVQAVAGVDLEVAAGQTLGIVGESGCGKSTTARMILRLIDSDEGSLRFDGEDVTRLTGSALRRLRSRIQFVPQNPRSSLNPRHTIAQSISFPLRVQGVSRRERIARVTELLEAVGLGEEHRDRYPSELSGGQLQRVAIARALSTRPEAVVCDEAVSALDKSVQAQVLNLLANLQKELGLSLIFISHDLAVVEHISDMVAVMYLGRVVEYATAEDLWKNPQHPYTKTLLSSTPLAGRQGIILGDGTPPPSTHRTASKGSTT